MILNEHSKIPLAVSKVMKEKGYKKLGSGVDQAAYLEPGTGRVLKIFGHGRSKKSEFSPDHRMFKKWVTFCNANKSNPYLPKYDGWESFELNGAKFLQIRMEPLKAVPVSYDFVLEILADRAELAAKGREYEMRFTVLNTLDDETRPYSRENRHGDTLHVDAGTLKDLRKFHNDLGEKGFLKFWETLVKVMRMGFEGHYTNDLHPANFMMRGKTPVIVDPWITTPMSEEKSMLTFKQFLTEASTGKDKWEKYFSGGDVETIAKNDGPLYDKFMNPVKKTVSKGDKIKVLAADEYSPKMLVRIDKGEYYMKFTDIEKPFKAEQEVSISLKPDVLGIHGPKFMSKYGAEVKKLIRKNSELPEEYAEYLCALVDLAEKPDDSKAKDKVTDLFIMSGVKEDTAFRNTVNNDFMEVLGPFFVVNEKPEYKDGGCKFPEAGNEPLYDFTMKAKRGENEQIDSFSSKRSGGASNTLKMTEILKAAAEATAATRRKYAREIELMKLIDENPVKVGPLRINEWLAKNFPKYKKVPTPTDSAGIAALESSVVKFINLHTDLNFVPLIKMAIPDLWYVKSRLNTDGTLFVEPLKAGREIGEAKLRSKSSPSHLSDKIGFAM